MKHLFVNLFSLVCMLLAGVGLTGCTDDKTEPDPGTWPSLEVKFLEAQYSTVKLEVTAANLTEIAYLATPKADAKETPTATIVFATGVKSAIADGVSSLTVSKLEPDTEYVIYVAATTANEEFFEKVLEVEAKTASFGDNAYDVFDVDYMSFSMNVKFQPTDPENVIKYLLIDMLTYNYQSMMNYTDADMMNLFDDIYHNYITENTVFVFNEENSILRDENGEPVTDEEGSMITLWNRWCLDSSIMCCSASSHPASTLGASVRDTICPFGSGRILRSCRRWRWYLGRSRFPCRRCRAGRFLDRLLPEDRGYQQEARKTR